MSIEQTQVVDFVSVDKDSGEIWLTISDHLPWDKDEGEHLDLLQRKLNAYLRFIESGELPKKYPNAIGREPVINLIGKYPLSKQATVFITKARAAIGAAGFRLRHEIKPGN